MGLSTLYRDRLLAKLLVAEDFESPSLYLSLHTDDPANVSGTEIGGRFYRRLPVHFTQPEEGSIWNDQPIEFVNMPDATITYFGVWDDQQEGNLVWSGELLVAEPVRLGNAVRFDKHQLLLTLE